MKIQPGVIVPDCLFNHRVAASRVIFLPACRIISCRRLAVGSRSGSQSAATATTDGSSRVIPVPPHGETPLQRQTQRRHDADTAMVPRDTDVGTSAGGAQMKPKPFRRLRPVRPDAKPNASRVPSWKASSVSVDSFLRHSR